MLKKNLGLINSLEREHMKNPNYKEGNDGKKVFS
jgi:hypothetical protein